MLTQASEDYLKAIYQLQQASEAATTSAIAALLGVTPASVTNMLKKLARLRLVVHTPYHGVQLTEGGRIVALEVVRHHRLIELYLSRHLGISLDKVHQEAERLEHVLSEDLEERLAHSLGQPTRDPHGDPIPTREGTVDEARHPVLADLSPGARGRIVRVSDRDPAILRELEGQELLPGASVQVTDILADGTVSVTIGQSRRRISPTLARAAYVEATA